MPIESKHRRACLQCLELAYLMTSLIILTVITHGSSRGEASGISVSVADTELDVRSLQNALEQLAKRPNDLTHPETQNHGVVPQAIPTLARVWPMGNTNKLYVSDVCHGLLFYGLGPTDLNSYPSGVLLLKAITDEEVAMRTFAKSPFVRTRNGLRYSLFGNHVSDSEVGEMHRDQCLATFAELDLPVATPIRLISHSYSISDLLSESMANFSLDQQEPAWTAMAFAKYLPPKKEWVSRFGERTSFSQLVQHLLHLNSNEQSCAGTHIFQALVKIDSVNRRYSILDTETQKRLDSYLIAMLHQVVRHQQSDGGWNKQWCDSMNSADSTGTMTPLQYRVLVTGHILEVLKSLDSQRRPPHAVFVRAAESLREILNSKEINLNRSLICPITHAARTARSILNPARTQGLSMTNAFHNTE